MIAGTTGDDLHIADFGEQLGGLRAEGLDHDVVLAQTPFQGALYYGWLLVDFLEHEVTVGTLVGGFGAFVVLHGFALYRVTGQIPDGYLVAADLGDVAFFQVHEAVGHLAQGQLVGSQEVLPVAQTDNQRAAAARSQQAVWLVRADHCQAIGTVQLLDRSLQGVGQVRDGLQGVVQQVDDDFGVGLGAEYVAQALEFFTQFFVILDDTVVHHRQFLAGEMRVCIMLGGRAVGSPAGVGNTQLACQRIGGYSGFQFADLADAATTLQGPLLGEDRQTCAVITAVLQTLEAFDEDGGDITFGDGANDSTH
ncbi:hypothetical protein D3C81_726890 [compost metagenome]